MRKKDCEGVGGGGEVCVGGGGEVCVGGGGKNRRVRQKEGMKVGWYGGTARCTPPVP